MRKVAETLGVGGLSGCEVVQFHDRAPWWGGDMQTLRNRFVAKRLALPSRTSPLEFALSDGSGDRLIGRLDQPLKVERNSPLILLVHGLTGCEDSTYLRETTRFHLVRGRPVLRLNLRGAGPGREVARGYYHAGCARDVQDAVDCLDDSCAQQGIFMVGFSLGGNILLNMLAKLVPGHHVLGAATVSAPIEPFHACRRLMQLRNSLYHHWLLQRMKMDVLSASDLSTNERREIAKARSVYQFDDRWVAPRNGFKGALDYYERTAGARFISSITVPTLMMHAMNDPWIPVAPYVRLLDTAPAAVTVMLAQSGGHVGFHQRGYAETWHDRMIETFLKHIL